MSLNIGIISQARMGSTRLPGKILKTINSISLLEYHLRGLEKASLPIVVATTDLKTDDIIISYCLKRNIPYFRGDETDVLSRYYHAAKKFNFDIVIRVTSDCPLINGTLIEEALKESGILNEKNLYVSNTLERTFPRGFDFEIFSFEMLKDAYQNSKEEHEREHVTPSIYKKALAENRTFCLKHKEDFSSYRLTVDTIEDFSLIDILIREFHADSLSVEELFEVLTQNQNLKEINADVKQKPIVW